MDNIGPLNIISSNFTIQLYNPLSIFMVISEFGAINYTFSQLQYTFKIPVNVSAFQLKNAS